MLKDEYKVYEEKMRKSIDSVAADFAAVRAGRAHGLWHNFYDAPTNILAIEAMAKWFYPERFADVDPQATMAEINQRFLPALPMQGAYWGDIAPLKAKP